MFRSDAPSRPLKSADDFARVLLCHERQGQAHIVRSKGRFHGVHNGTVH
jgi:hypothetical protein